MRILGTRGLILALSLLGVTSRVSAQGPVFGSPTLLPPVNRGSYDPQLNSAPGTSIETPTMRRLPTTGTESQPDLIPPRPLSPPPPAAKNGYSIVSTSNWRQPGGNPIQPLPSPTLPVPEPENVPGNVVPPPSGSMPAPAISMYDSLGYGKSTNSTPCTGPDACGTTCCAPGCLWYAGVNGLYMTRSRDDHHYFSYSLANEAVQLLDARDVGMDWAGGVEARIGRYINCGCNAVELVYWTLSPADENTILYGSQVPGGIGGILNWSSVTYNGLGGDQYVDNAFAHGLVTQYNLHNVEVNLLGLTCCNPCMTGCCGPRTNWNWLAGFRYFHYEEDMEFVSDPNDGDFTGEADELYFRQSVKNNLYGFQVGGNGRWWLTDRFALNGGVKAGIFANYVDYDAFIGGSAGVAVINNGPNQGVAWSVQSDKVDCAFMSELDLGFSYQILARLRATAGYRIVAISDAGLPANQTFSDLRGISDFQQVDTACGFFLHGAYMGAEFCF